MTEILQFHIEYVALKISKIIGVIARLRHFVSLCSLLNIYRSLIFPYMSNGLAAWGQATKPHLQKVIVLPKRVLLLMYFFLSPEDTSPINMLYVETVSSLMYDVSSSSVPSNISDLLTKVNKIHTHKTRSSSSGNIYIKPSSLSLNQRFFARFGDKLWNSLSFPCSHKGNIKKLSKYKELATRAHWSSLVRVDW